MYWQGAKGGGANAAILVSEFYHTPYISSCFSMWTVLLLLSLLNIFKIDTAIESHAICVMCSVIMFLLTKNHKPIKMYKQLHKVIEME